MASGTEKPHGHTRMVDRFLWLVVTKEKEELVFYVFGFLCERQERKGNESLCGRMGRYTKVVGRTGSAMERGSTNRQTARCAK